MKLFSKTVYDYFTVSWKFLVTLFMVAGIIVFLRLSSGFPSSIQTLFSIAGFVCMGMAGWSVVRNHSFNLKQALFVGILLSFGIHWMLPIFHSAYEVMYLLLVNTLIYSIIVFCGACLAMMVKKQGG